ncbi:MAG TPA: hypothetical protein VNP98_01965 [Chthoniobacterales bacterium]|nr:hypothetical protein [Chthoniobacterales bacterium]
MGWKIIFAPQALDEVEQIVRFIAQDDADAAVRFGIIWQIARNHW